MKLTRRTALVGAGAAMLSARARAEKKYGPGVTDTEIKIGQTMPYSGNALAYGANGRNHAAYFRMINETQGGVNGRKINFVSLDDEYNPAKTLELARGLVEQEKVLCLFYPLGTATNSAIRAYMNEQKVPQLFVASGASKWGKPAQYPWTIGWQPDYFTEGQIYAKHVLANHPNPKIGVLRQNDDLGNDYMDGFDEGLVPNFKKYVVADETYEATDKSIDAQIVRLKASGAEVFFNIATPKFATQAILKMTEIGWKPVHYLASIANSVGAVLKPAGFEKSQGLLTAQYYKDVNDSRWGNDPDVKEWRAYMAKWNPEGKLSESANVTSYISVSAFIQVLKNCGDDLTRENLMHQATTLRNLKVPLTLPGLTVSTGPADFYPMKSLQLSRFEGDHWVPFGDLISIPKS